MDLKELEQGIDPNRHWYYQSKKVPMIRFFKSVVNKMEGPVTVIDFGSGSGFFAIDLYKRFPGKVKEVLLIDINYSEEEIEATKEEKIKKLLAIPDGIENAIVLMMDVLEHVPDDAAIMKDILNRLSQNCWYFITVPAFQSLWSEHDVYLGHYRRYTRPMLTRLLESQSIKPENRYYIFGWIFPLVWIVRKISNLRRNKASEPSSDMSNTPALVNFILRWLNTFEMNFRKANIFFGVTVVAEGKLK